MVWVLSRCAQLCTDLFVISPLDFPHKPGMEVEPTHPPDVPPASFWLQDWAACACACELLHPHTILLLEGNATPEKQAHDSKSQVAVRGYLHPPLPDRDVTVWELWDPRTCQYGPETRN